MRAIALSCLVTALALGSAAGAQTPPTPVYSSDITVYGKVLRDAPHLVERFSIANSGERLARWRTPICIDVRGLEPDHAAWVKARIGDLAQDAGIPVDDLRCHPNLIVDIASDDVAERDKIVQQRNGFLNVGSRWPIDETQLAAFRKDDGEPAHIFYTITDANASNGDIMGAGYTNTPQYAFNINLGAPVVAGPASRLIPRAEPNFTRVFLVLDGKQTQGLSLKQIAAYAAMVSLAEVRIDAPLTQPDTITAVFADAKTGQHQPEDITLWDHAYLHALYATQPQPNIAMQRSDLADRLRRVVKATVGTPPADR